MRRVVERRGGDRLVDDGVARPGEAHARRARELAPLHDEVVEGAARQRHLGALAVRREGRVLPAVHDELVVHVDARAVVEEDVERVHVRRGRHDLAAPARRHVVAAVGRHGAVAPVEVDLGVHAHDRRVALQPGVVEVLGREAALHELAHDDVGVARRRRRVAARVGRQAGDLLLDAHARRAARERRRVAGHDLAGRARRVAAREQRRVAAQELEVAELRAERDHPVRLAVVPLGLGDVDAVERRQRLEGRLDGRGRRVVGDRRRRLVVERQGEGAVQGRRVAARRRHRLLLVDVRRGLHLAQVAELLREGDRVLDGVAQHLLGDVDLVDGRDLLEPRLDRRRGRVEGDVARVVALVGHGEGPAQAGLALDELDDVEGLDLVGPRSDSGGVQHDEVPDVAHGAHEGDVPRRALEGVGVDAVLGRARRHDDVVDAVELLEGLLDLERRRRGTKCRAVRIVVNRFERRRSVRATVELQNEFAFGCRCNRATVADDVHRLHVGHELDVRAEHDDLRLRDALLDARHPGVRRAHARSAHEDLEERPRAEVRRERDVVLEAVVRRPVARHVDGLDVAEGLEGHLDHVGRRVRAQLLRLAGAVGRQVDLRRLAAHVAQPVVVAAARGVRVVVREREEAVEVAREVQPLDLVRRGVVRRDAAVGVVRVVARVVVAPELREEDVEALAAARRRQVPERRAGGLLGLDRERVRAALEELRDLREAVVDLVVAGPRRQLERRHVAGALEERDRVRAEGLAVRRLVAPRDVHPADVEVVRREGLLPGLRRVHAAEAGAELRLGREAQPHVDVADAQVHAHDLLLVDDAGHAHAEGRAARRRLRRRRARARRDRERRARQHAAAQQIEGLDLEGVEGVRREAGDLVVEHVRRVRAVVDEDRGRARQHRLDVDVRAVVVVVGARVHEAARRRAHERHVARLGVERDHPLEAAEGVRLVARHRDDRDGLEVLELGLDGDGVGVHGDRDRLLAAEGQRERARQLVRAGEEPLDRHVVGVAGGVGVDLGLVDGHEGHLAPAVERDRLVRVAVHAVVARDVDALVARRLAVVAADGVGDGVLPLRVRRRPLEGLGPLAVDVEAHDGVELRVLEEDALALGRRAVRVDDDALDLLLDRVRVRHSI